MKRGDNLNSYGEKKGRIDSVRRGFAGRWKFFRRGEKKKKKLGESQRRARGSKNGENREDEKRFYASVFASILCLGLNE